MEREGEEKVEEMLYYSINHQTERNGGEGSKHVRACRIETGRGRVANM